MTALDQYIRLESTGRWREHEDAPWREVLVSFGNASLVLSNFQEEPLTHWSLAAVERLGEEENAVLYAPDASAAEVLAVSDADMVTAIRDVTAMARNRAAPVPKRRLRRPVTALLALALIGAAVGFGPGTLRGMAAKLPSPEQRGLMAEAISSDLGDICVSPGGMRSLDLLSTRLGHVPGISVHIGPRARLARLPDGRLVVPAILLEQSPDPESFAAVVALALGAGSALAPFDSWVRTAPILDLGRFLALGRLNEEALASMRAAPARPWSADPATLQRAADHLRAAEVSTAGLAHAWWLKGDGGEPPEIPADGDTNPRPVYGTDRAWIALRDICAS